MRDDRAVVLPDGRAWAPILTGPALCRVLAEQDHPHAHLASPWKDQRLVTAVASGRCLAFRGPNREVMIGKIDPTGDNHTN